MKFVVFCLVTTYICFMEIWAPIRGYEGRYEISSLGRVKSLPKIKIVKKVGFYITKERHLKYSLIDYPHVTLTNSVGVKKTECIHRLVAIAFIPNPENKPEVNHIDANPKNFSISNLEWVTKSENELHAFRIGNKVPIRGEDSIQCKLKDSQISEIRDKYRTGLYTTRKLGLEYSVSPGYISMIINNKKR